MTEVLGAPTTKQLVEWALQFRLNAYAPYSNYCVGAALYGLQEGKHRVIGGCNIENASYGMAICAERAAVCSALSGGKGWQFVKIAVVTKDGASGPCGACRQFLYEFNPEIEIIMADESGRIVSEGNTLASLLPGAFGPHNL